MPPETVYGCITNTDRRQTTVRARPCAAILVVKKSVRGEWGARGDERRYGVLRAKVNTTRFVKRDILDFVYSNAELVRTRVF